MNLRGNSGNVTDVEDLRRQIETALGNVDEIVKNNAVINVATTAEATTNGIGNNNDDEMVVYVSIKLNKSDPRLQQNNISGSQYHGYEPSENHVDFRNAGAGDQSGFDKKDLTKKVNMTSNQNIPYEVTGGTGGARGLKEEMSRPQDRVGVKVNSSK